MNPIYEHKSKIIELIMKSNFPVDLNEPTNIKEKFKKKLEREIDTKKMINIKVFGKNLIQAFARHFGEEFFSMKYFTFNIQNNITNYNNTLFLLSYTTYPKLLTDYPDFQNHNKSILRTLVPSKKENSMTFTNCCFWFSCEQNVDFIRCNLYGCRLFSTTKINVSFHNSYIHNNGITFSKISKIKNIFYLIINRGNLIDEDIVSNIGPLNRILRDYLIDVLNFIIIQYIGIEELYA
jgi:hypothetical protein